MPKRQPQTSFNDKGQAERDLSSNGEISYAVEQYAKAESDYDECRETVKGWNHAKKALRKLIEDKGLEQGRYRVGQFVFDIGERKGGGFQIKKWTSVRIDFLSDVAAPSSNGSSAAD